MSGLSFAPARPSIASCCHNAWWSGTRHVPYCCQWTSKALVSSLNTICRLEERADVLSGASARDSRVPCGLRGDLRGEALHSELGGDTTLLLLFFEEDERPILATLNAVNVVTM